jgi:isopenicillin N synthase-like dioxygenase
MMPASASPPLDENRAAALEAQAYLKARLQPTSTKTSFRSIPIIDLSPSFSTALSDRQSVAKQINEACMTVGFFYITGHGVESACPKALALAERFFSELSQESKDKIHMKHSKYFRGYEPASYSSVNDFTTKETKEAFNWGYEAGLDPTGGDGKYVELDGSPAANVNLWPDEAELPEFYEGVKSYYGQVSIYRLH